MATFSFKSSGTTQSAQQNAVSKTQTPIGILTPLQLSTTDGLLAMSYNIADQVSDNLRNLIQGNWGEKLMQYDWGANLRPLMSEYASDQDFGEQAIQRISQAVSKWMPYIVLDSFDVASINSGNKKLVIKDVTVTFDIPSLGAYHKSIKARLYAL